MAAKGDFDECEKCTSFQCETCGVKKTYIADTLMGYILLYFLLMLAGHFFFVPLSLWVFAFPIIAFIIAGVVSDAKKKNPNKNYGLAILICVCVAVAPLAMERLGYDFKATKVAAESKRTIDQNKNPFNDPIVSMREIQSEQMKYLGKTVVVGPVKVRSNRVENGTFLISPSKSINIPGWDNDVDMTVLYKDTSDYAKWRDLSSDKYPIIYVKGKIVPVQYSNSMGMVAIEIKFITLSE